MESSGVCDVYVCIVHALFMFLFVHMHKYVYLCM